MTAPREILAFVHVEKAAGTTLIHILRYNFFLRHLDVRPYTSGSGGVFGPRDLEVAMRVNPAIACIAGHSVTAYSRLEESGRRIRYITMLRDPVKRYLSQFQYVVEQRNERMSFEEFMRNDWFANFQTRKFSRHADIEEAKAVLNDKFALVGTADRFDEFLVMLQRKLAPTPFDARYKERNLAKNTLPLAGLLRRHGEEIRERNRLDIELYRFACDELRPRFAREFGPDLDAEVRSLQQRNRAQATRLRPYLDYVYRRGYAGPVTSLVRRLNGMPAAGAY